MNGSRAELQPPEKKKMNIKNAVFTMSLAAFPAAPARFFTRARKQLFAVAVSFALLAGGLAPCVSLDQIGRDEIAGIIASQSVLTSFFYHTTLPMKIVNKMMADMQSMADTSKNAPSGDEDKNAAKAASGSAIVPAAAAVLKAVMARSVNPALSSLEQSLCGSLCDHTVLLASTRVPGGNGYLPAVILLLCFFMLPRSSINGEASALFRV